MGVQKDTGSLFTQYECNGTAALSNGLMLTFTQPSCAGTGTPGTATRTPTSPPAGSATATATCVAQTAAWTDRAVITASPGLTRADGAYWAANGLVYVLGGRTTDTAGDFNDTIYTYNPGTNAWAVATGALTDTSTSNLAVAVLTGPSGPRIYAIGGAVAGAGVTPSGIVRIYDPTTGTVTNGTTWPMSPPILPGGWTVYNNKLYIFGGFDPVTGGGATPPDNWIFDPASGGGTWTHVTGAPLSLGRGYSAVAAIGNFIYIAGGSQFSGGTLTNETMVERFDPATNTICDACVADMLSASSNFKGFTDGTLLYAPGGTFPTAVNTMQVYDPGSNTWSMGATMAHGVRNYARATIGSGSSSRFYAVGGYEGAAISNWNQLYTPAAPCSTSTPTPPITPGNTSTATRTNTPSNTPTSPGATGTSTRTNTPTSTSTNSPTNTPTLVPTQTPGGPSATTVPSNTSTSTDTPVPGSGTDTPTATVTSTVCPIQFSDVPNGSTFYVWIRCLACRLIVNGYSDGTFRPNNNVTRGQLSKIVSNSAGFSDPQTTQMFEDVPPGSTFFDYIGRLASRGYISGYPCGSTGEPCVHPTDLPYFRTNNNATRGQITKIVSNAAGFVDPPAGQIFEDVPPGSTFYTYTQRLASRGVMQGYPCGSPGEPCIHPTDRPYFRTFNNATRGQTSKIDANTFFPNCDTPAAVKPAAVNQ